MISRTILRAFNSVQQQQTRRCVSTIKPFYVADSTATGAGRVGFVKGTEGFATEMGLPKELKGYASCFLGAVHAAAAKLKVAIPKDTSVNVKAALGNIETNGTGFGLAVEITTSFPGLDKAKAREIVDIAHNEICPYSKATRNNIVVDINVGN
ncbi:hypothetical protein HK100_012160 [Physocladia obscura]|uniref:Organic hydroperoxide resistance protein n=1 Tax=Physocladia obscura TaxID=109957 RepID=A0AAD5XGG2_9FUNG|nr:hypothetical protein HK100_012160 [Physocladia obscura]